MIKTAGLAVVLCICALAFSGGSHASDTGTAARPKIGLVLSGGGAKGLAQIGVIEVLEEAGIEVDCISGTSMGAAVGALYAIGYKAADIEKIAREQNWGEILGDTISRRNVSIEEKDELERYVGAFPIRHGKISLPAGLTAGQKLSAVLSRLTLPVHAVDDFRKLPIPFACVATDIETGEAVVLDRGFLPDALRASMSLPTIFAPVELNGRLLADGYLVRNLPASDVRALGADIVIGVDVGAPLYGKEDIDSLVKVLEQVMRFRGAAATEEQHRLCDILIMPDVGEYGVSSFGAIDSLIVRGKRAAREQLPRLKALADSLKQYPREQKQSAPPAVPRDIYVTDLRFEGLRNVSSYLLMGKLNIEVPSHMTPTGLERAIESAYGSQFFERITYKLEPFREGYRLIIRVVEQDESFFKFGFHYDSNMKSALLLNTTFRNVLGQGSKLMFNARLSQNPGYSGSYFVSTNWRPGVGLSIQTSYDKFEVYTYKPNGKLESSLDYSLFETNILLQTIFANTFSLGAGVQYHYSEIESKIVPEDWEDMHFGQLNFMGYITLDTLDRSVFPRNGFQFYGEALSVTDLLKIDDFPDMKPFKRYALMFTEVLPVHNRISLFGSFYGGMSSKDDLPPDYYFYIGGFHPARTTFFPFAGLKFMEKTGSTAYVSEGGIQYEFRKDMFLILRGNRGKAVLSFEDIFSNEGLNNGVGLTAGMLSPIGPIDYTVMKGSGSRGLLTYVNIGFRF
ncbi:patatin-like phospholipase family protein [bacterium]|nr:patatin-like phospholipase family protein [bacterium]